jgi:predicted transcriptional regulator
MLLAIPAKEPTLSRLRAILDPLEKHWQFIEVRSRGRKSEVSLTEQGKTALRIFGSGRDL